MLADGVVSGEELICELLADDDVVVVVEALVLGKDAAAQQRNLHDAEVLRVRGQGHGIVLKAVAGCRFFHDRKDPIAVGAGSGSGGDEGRATHAGQAAHAFEQRLVEEHYLVARIVLDFRQAELHGQHIVDAAAQVCGAQAQEAVEEQACGCEKRYRQRNLRGQHGFAKPCPRGASADRACGIPQSGERSFAGGGDGRNQAGRQCGCHYQANREGEDPSIHMDGFGAWEVAPVGGQPLRGSEREQQAKAAAGEADQETLGHLLADEREPATAERSADCDLFATGCRARHEQVRNVETRDEQHAADCAEKHQ